MNIINEMKKFVSLELVKWVGVSFFLVLSVVGSFICSNYSLARNCIVFVFVMIALSILLTTEFGKLAAVFGKEVYVELQKVVWPTFHDGLNTTLVIIAVTIVMSLILWGLDTILVHVISFSLRL